jgi:hypothetical protein
MMINRKGFGSKQSWPNFKVLFWHSPVETEKNHENLSQDSRSPRPRIEHVPPEYEAGLLTTRLRRSVQTNKREEVYSNQLCCNSQNIRVL